MIYSCPHCGKKNRLPDRLRPDGVYHCGQCKALLTPPLSEEELQAQNNIARQTSPETQAVRKPPSRRRLPIWLLILTVPYVLFLVALTYTHIAGPERWWFTSINLYMPQWLWAIPAVPLLLLYLIFARRYLAIPLALLLYVAGPLMGFCFGIPRIAPANALRLRVMTYNVKWSRRDSARLIEEVRETRPDIILMQDAAGSLQRGLGEELKGWNIRLSGQYIVASRLPITDLEYLDISFPNSRHHAVRARLQLGDIPVTIYTVHLLSPRYGLYAVRQRQIPVLQRNTASRLIEARLLANHITTAEHNGDTGPVILTGDLNSPSQGLVCRTFKEIGLKDAFEEAGFGYGYTYGQSTRIEHPYVRIDHIFVSPHWQVAKCFVGTSEASDHSPVIADIFLTKP